MSAQSWHTVFAGLSCRRRCLFGRPAWKGHLVYGPNTACAHVLWLGNFADPLFADPGSRSYRIRATFPVNALKFLKIVVGWPFSQDWLVSRWQRMSSTMGDLELFSGVTGVKTCFDQMPISNKKDILSESNVCMWCALRSWLAKIGHARCWPDFGVGRGDRLRNGQWPSVCKWLSLEKWYCAHKVPLYRINVLCVHLWP